MPSHHFAHPRSNDICGAIANLNIENDYKQQYVYPILPFGSIPLSTRRYDPNSAPDGACSTAVSITFESSRIPFTSVGHSRARDGRQVDSGVYMLMCLCSPNREQRVQQCKLYTLPLPQPPTETLQMHSRRLLHTWSYHFLQLGLLSIFPASCLMHSRIAVT